MESEVRDLQNRLARSVAQCQDKIKDKYGFSDKVDQAAAKLEMEQCVVGAGNELLSSLPSIEKRISKNLLSS